MEVTGVPLPPRACVATSIEGGAEGVVAEGVVAESASEEEAALLVAAVEESAVAAADAVTAEAEAAQDTMETLLDVYDARLNSLCDQIEQVGSMPCRTRPPRAR